MAAAAVLDRMGRGRLPGFTLAGGLGGQDKTQDNPHGDGGWNQQGVSMAHWRPHTSMSIHGPTPGIGEKFRRQRGPLRRPICNSAMRMTSKMMATDQPIRSSPLSAVIGPISRLPWPATASP